MNIWIVWFDFDPPPYIHWFGHVIDEYTWYIFVGDVAPPTNIGGVKGDGYDPQPMNIDGPYSVLNQRRATPPKPFAVSSLRATAACLAFALLRGRVFFILVKCI
jgi:hypothetical protein